MAATMNDVPGLDPERLQRVYASMERDIEAEICDGAVLLVARGGHIAMHEALGWAHRESRRATRLDDVFHLNSISKQMTACTVLQAIDRGDLSLLTPVCEIVEEFGRRGKQRVTVRDILSHQSGINTEIPFGVMMPSDIFNIEALVARISDERIFRRPGRSVSYNAMSAHAVLAEMVRRIDGGERTFGQILRDDLFEPLGMGDTSFSLRADLAERRVPLVARYRSEGLFDPIMLTSMNDIYDENTEFPSGGVIGTTADLFRFTEMLRRGGELDGVRILSREILAEALTNQTGEHPNDIFDYAREMRGWPDWPAYIGLTFFLRGEGLFPTSMGHLTSPSTYSGQGAGSTLFWVDPERDLTFICLTAGLLEDGDNMLRFQRLSDLVVGAVC